MNKPLDNIKYKVKHNTFSFVIRPISRIILLFNVVYILLLIFLKQTNLDLLVEINHYSNMCFGVFISLYLMVIFNPIYKFNITDDDHETAFFVGGSLLCTTITTTVIGSYIKGIFNKVVPF